MLQCNMKPSSLLSTRPGLPNRFHMVDLLGLLAKLVELPCLPTDGKWLSLTFAARLKNGLFVKSCSDFQENFS
jgi:hypothetical protein